MGLAWPCLFYLSLRFLLFIFEHFLVCAKRVIFSGIDHISFLHIFFEDIPPNLLGTGALVGFSACDDYYFYLCEGSASQYSLSCSLPSTILANQSSFHRSNVTDFTRVYVGPSARCAPEQLQQRNTPKSSDAPKWLQKYMWARGCRSPRRCGWCSVLKSATAFFFERGSRTYRVLDKCYYLELTKW